MYQCIKINNTSFRKFWIFKILMQETESTIFQESGLPQDETFRSWWNKLNKLWGEKFLLIEFLKYFDLFSITSLWKLWCKEQKQILLMAYPWVSRKLSSYGVEVGIFGATCIATPSIFNFSFDFCCSLKMTIPKRFEEKMLFYSSSDSKSLKKNDTRKHKRKDSITSIYS